MVVVYQDLKSRCGVRSLSHRKTLAQHNLQSDYQILFNFHHVGEKTSEGLGENLKHVLLNDCRDGPVVPPPGEVAEMMPGKRAHLKSSPNLSW